MKHLFQPQCYENRKQLKEENWKILKCVEIKQHAIERPMGQRKKSKQILKILKQMKMEVQHTKTYRMYQKHF